MIRAFVGLPLPERVSDALEMAQIGLPAGRMIDPEDFHVTLAFLGEQPAPVLEDLHLALQRIRAPRPLIRIEGAGLFGGAEPTIYHARIAPDSGLSHLRAKVLQAARETGIAIKSQRFTPHVTLARFGQGLKGEDALEMSQFAAGRAHMPIEPFEAEEFALFRSHLGKAGAHYESMAEYPLG